MALFFDRVLGALALKAATFEAVARDPRATAPALIVVIAASVASSLGVPRLADVVTPVAVLVWQIVAWAVIAGTAWVLGTRVVPGRNRHADFWQVLRPVGFAHAPRILLALAAWPVVAPAVRAVATLWSLVATVIAVRQAVDYDDTAKAIVVTALSVAVFWLLVATFGPGLPLGWH